MRTVVLPICPAGRRGGAGWLPQRFLVVGDHAIPALASFGGVGPELVRAVEQGQRALA
jgi:hypothetical protein